MLYVSQNSSTSEKTKLVRTKYSQQQECNTIFMVLMNQWNTFLNIIRRRNGNSWRKNICSTNVILFPKKL